MLISSQVSENKSPLAVHQTKSSEKQTEKDVFFTGAHLSLRSAMLYVHCNFCDTVLAVSVPCSSLFKTVTIRCGHCTNLLSVNMLGLSLPTHTPHNLLRDDVINQAQTTRAVSGSQRALCGDVKGKVRVPSDKFPVIRGLFGDVQGKMEALGSIRRRRSRDTLILSAVIAACTLCLVIYWVSKKLEM